MKQILTIAAVLVGSVVGAQTTAPLPEPWASVGKTIGTQGAVNADGSFRINIPRTDVSFASELGMPIPVDLGLATYIAFYGDKNRALAVGDIAMLRGEIDGVVDALLAGGFEIVALHNHMTTENPRLFFLHFQAVGQPFALASGFKNALAILGKSVPIGTLPIAVKPQLNADELGSALGAKAEIKPSGILRYSHPRKDLAVTVDGIRFTPAMGLASWAAFNACECGKTMVMGDTCCTREELQRVLTEFRKAGISVTSIHNHTLGASREVMFVHYEGEGNAPDLAVGIRKVWDSSGG
jgi:hypothetical protein